MIATVSPGAASTDHSLNTLRYADRIKEQRATTAVSSHSSSKSAGAILSPRPQAPTKQRLQLIASANQMAAVRRDDAADEILAQQHRTLSPTGLAEPVRNSLSPITIEPEDEDISLEELMADGDEAFEEEDDPNYEPSEDNNADEEYETAEEDDDFYRKVNTPQQDEEEMRLIVQDLFELEEALLNQHMSNIQEHAEMLTHEGKLLQNVQGAGEDEIDEYAIQLAEFLDRKEILVYKLQQKLGEFKSQLAKEQEMAQRVRSLSQY
jgi:kinesin family protein 2/24